MDKQCRYIGNQYVNAKGRRTRFKTQVDLFSIGRNGRDSYLQFTVKKWMKLLDQRDIKGKVCIHDLEMVLRVTDQETMEMWLQELAVKHNIPPDEIKEYITKPCYPIEKLLHDGKEVKMSDYFRCSSMAESTWFAKNFWALDYVVQGNIMVPGNWTGR